MYKRFFISILFIFFFTGNAFAIEKGNLVIIGGGECPEYIVKKIVDLAGEKKAGY